MVKNDANDFFVRVVGFKKNKGSYYFLFILLILLLIGLGVIVIKNNKVEVNLDKHAISYHVEGMRNNDPTKIVIPVFSTFEAKVGEREMEYHLANPEGNPCYFKYSIILVGKEKEEELYQSELIKPGTAIPKFNLNRKLDVGEYDGIIRIKTYNLKDPESEMNGGEVTIKIVIKESE